MNLTSFDRAILTKKVNDLHTKAMDLVEAAMVCRIKGDKGKVAGMIEQAYRNELAAAKLVPEGFEPTRSVLYRSAASLAIECGFKTVARELITKGLAGDPPDEIAEELRVLAVLAQE